MTAYLDHAATTPMLPLAVAAMVEELSQVGNASSLHTSGRRVRRVVEEAREQLAAALGAGPSEVIFTAGGTEADNLAIKGLYWARRDGDPTRRRIVAGSTEHHAVLDPIEWLVEHEGAEVVWLPVDPTGRVDLVVLEQVLAADPASIALVTVMWANNEVGTVQPVAEVVALAHAHGIPVHTDAVQAAGHLPVDFAAVGADALTVSGHKLGGPVGAAALLARRGLGLSPLIHGGGQERGIRSGTLDSAAIRAFAVAAEHAVATRPSEVLRLTTLRDQLIAAVLTQVPDAVLRGAPVGGGSGSGSGAVAADGGSGPTGSDAQSLNRLPGNAHFTFPGCEGGLVALLARRPGRGVLDRLSLPSRSAATQPCAAGHGVAEPVARGALRSRWGTPPLKPTSKPWSRRSVRVVDRARGAGLTGAEPAKASATGSAAPAPGSGSGSAADTSAGTKRASSSGASASTILKEEVTP